MLVTTCLVDPSTAASFRAQISEDPHDQVHTDCPWQLLSVKEVWQQFLLSTKGAVFRSSGIIFALGFLSDVKAVIRSLTQSEKSANVGTGHDPNSTIQLTECGQFRFRYVFFLIPHSVPFSRYVMLDFQEWILVPITPI